MGLIRDDLVRKDEGFPALDDNLVGGTGGTCADSLELVSMIGCLVAKAWVFGTAITCSEFPQTTPMLNSDD